MLHIVPRLFSLQNDFDIFDGFHKRGYTRTPFFVLTPPNVLLKLDDVQYQLMQYPKPMTKWWQLEFTLRLVPDQALYLDNKPLVIAKPQFVGPGKLFSVSYVVEYENSLFEIGKQRESPTSELTVLEYSSHTNDQIRKIGRIYVQGFMSNRKAIDLPDRIPPFLQVFFFLVARSFLEPSTA